MRGHARFLTGILLIAVFLTLSPAAAVAAPLLTQLGGDTVIVSSGEFAESVIAVGTDARIAGSVSDIVLVINGNVYLEPASNTALVIDLGGHVTNQSSVQQGIFEVNFTNQFLNNLFLGGALLLGIWFIKLLLSLAGIVLLTGLSYLLKGRLHRWEGLISTSVVQLFGIGTASLFVIAALVILLSLTVVGIPLVVVLLLISAIAAVLGTLPVINLIGEKVLCPKLLSYPELTRLLIQSVIFVSFANIPLLGFVFLLGMGIIGLGLALTLGWMYLKRRKTPA